MKKLISVIIFILFTFCALFTSCSDEETKSNVKTNNQVTTQNGSNNTTNTTTGNISTNTNTNTSTNQETNDARVVSIDLKGSLPNEINVNDIDNELSKIVYVVTKTDGSKVEINLSKNMLSSKDYEDLHTLGSHEISFYIDNVLKTITLNSVNSQMLLSWTVNFSYDNNKNKEVIVKDGQNALAPTDVTGYIDNGIYYEFSGWSDTFNEVHENKNINALYTSSSLFDLEVVILSESEVEVLPLSSNLITDYELQVKKEDGTLVKSISKDTTDTTVANLDTGVSIVSGSYEYSFNNETHRLQVSKTFSTSVISKLATIEPKIDENTISNTELCVDVSEYALNAPEGYRLKTVFLMNESTEEIVGKFDYDDENTIAYFDNLEEDTEYRTCFAYDEVDNKLSLHHKNFFFPYYNSPFPFRVTEGYSFFFVGFVIRTRNSTSPMRCVRVVYDDPVLGEKLLYRYYVSDGDSVPYHDHLYNTPWSFTLPDIYHKYYAIGDYKDMENITADKKVPVYLIPKPWADVDTNPHRVVFIDSETHYIIDTVLFNDGETIEEPAFSKYVPTDSDVYHYEFAWSSLTSSSLVDLSEVKGSQVLYTSYKSFEKYVEPKLRFTDGWCYNRLFIGSDFVKIDLEFNSTKAIIHDDSSNVFSNVDAYLTRGEVGQSDERIEKNPSDNEYFSGSKNYCVTFSNLDAGKYVIHVSFKYNLNDGTEDKIKTFEIPFETSNEEKKDMTLSSPNFQTIKIETTFKDKNYGFRIIPNSNSENEYFESEKGTLIYNNAEDFYEHESFNCNTEYRVYTTRFDATSFIYYENGQLSSDGKAFKTLISSKDYSIVKTLDGVEPNSFVLKIRGIKSQEGYWTACDYQQKGDIKLEVRNYATQIDIGTIEVVGYLYSNSDFMNEPYHDPYSPQIHRDIRIYFKYDEEVGALVPKDGMFYDIINALNGYNESVIDPETGETYQYFFFLEHLDIYYFYNGGQYRNVLNVWGSRSDYVPSSIEESYVMFFQ